MNRRRLWSGLALSLLAILCATSLWAQTAPNKPVKKKAAVTKPVPAPAEVKTEPPAPADDVSLHSRLTTGAQVSENTTYIRGPRQRVEFPGLTVIQQCDLHRTLQINENNKRYLVQKHAAPATAAPAVPAAQTPVWMDAMAGATMAGGMMPGTAPPPAGGVITWTMTITDTGEGKEFGRQARDGSSSEPQERLFRRVVCESHEPLC